MGMKFFKVRIVLYLFFMVLGGLLFFCPNNAFSRPVRLIYSGGSIQLNLTSLTDYQGGISLPNWTKIKISVDTTEYNLGVGAYTGWRLYIWTADSQILSDDGNPNIDLKHLTLTPVGFSAIPDSDYTFPNSINPYTLIDTEKVLVQGTILNGFEATFAITYEFGKPPNTLINSPWGFYYTQLYFKLELY